ncbi:MAG: DUF2283 domain-containing protein [Candidatus Nanoarchaeia archaeon]|nr:DUF2283 domain-containing protein [Candidatus Nanoarchaeia archaeon]
MKNQIKVYYDKEGDFLEISIGKPSKCYAAEMKPDVFVRKDEETDEIKSIGILNFKKRIEEDIDIELLFEGKISQFN